MPVAESGPVSASVPPMRTGCCARAKTLKQASAIAPSIWPAQTTRPKPLEYHSGTSDATQSMAASDTLKK